MDTKAIATENRLSHWTEVMRERSASGLSIREYCRRAGLHENLYYYWQKKLRNAAFEKIKKENCSVVAKSADAVPSGWVSVSAERDNTDKSNATTLSIEVNGCQIIVNAETDIDLVAKVCRTLVAL